VERLPRQPFLSCKAAHGPLRLRGRSAVLLRLELEQVFQLDEQGGGFIELGLGPRSAAVVVQALDDLVIGGALEPTIGRRPQQR
jgi:hypothetical protein